MTALQSGLKAWREGVTAVDEARTGAAKATDAWTRQVEKTYGALVQAVGRAGAEGFFPRSRAGSKPSAPTPAPLPAPTP